MAVPPPSATRLALDWTVDPPIAVAVLVAALLYAGGVRRLLGRDRNWPAGRAAAFAAGLMVIVIATQSGLALYDTERFSIHVTQHVLLGMVAPVLLALGAPITLALQAARRPVQHALARVVHGPAVATLTHPAVAGALVGLSLFGLYFTPLFHLSLANAAIHAGVHLHFLVAGCAFFWPVLGTDVSRRRLAHGVRMLLVLVLVPVHAVLGLTILSTRHLLADGWYGADGRTTSLTAALADQHVAGGLLWMTGDLVGLVAAGVVLAQWMGHDEREAAREDRRLDALAHMNYPR